MAKVICIAGESGSGKTTSMRNLDPATTYYIDADKKGLSWKGWRNQYNTEKKNYLKNSFLCSLFLLIDSDSLHPLKFHYFHQKEQPD